MPFYNSIEIPMLHEIRLIFPHLEKHQRREKVQGAAAMVIKTFQDRVNNGEEILIFCDSYKVENLGESRNSFWKCQHMLILKHNMLLRILRVVTEITGKLLLMCSRHFRRGQCHIT